MGRKHHSTSKPQGSKRERLSRKFVAGMADYDTTMTRFNAQRDREHEGAWR